MSKSAFSGRLEVILKLGRQLARKQNCFVSKLHEEKVADRPEGEIKFTYLASNLNQTFQRDVSTFSSHKSLF